MAGVFTIPASEISVRPTRRYLSREEVLEKGLISTDDLSGGLYYRNLDKQEEFIYYSGIDYLRDSRDEIYRMENYLVKQGKMTQLFREICEREMELMNPIIDGRKSADGLDLAIKRHEETHRTQEMRFDKTRNMIEAYKIHEADPSETTLKDMVWDIECLSELQALCEEFTGSDSQTSELMLLARARRILIDIYTIGINELEVSEYTYAQIAIFCLDADWFNDQITDTELETRVTAGIKSFLKNPDDFTKAVTSPQFLLEIDMSLMRRVDELDSEIKKH